MSDALEKLKIAQNWQATKLDRDRQALALIEHCHKELTNLGFEAGLTVSDHPTQSVQLGCSMQWQGVATYPGSPASLDEKPAPGHAGAGEGWSVPPVATVPDPAATTLPGDAAKILPAKKSPGMPPAIWVADKIQRLKELHAQGLKIPQMAAELGLKSGQVQSKYYELKLNKLKPSPTPPAARLAGAPVPPAAPPETLPETSAGQGALTGATDVPLAERRVETRLDILTEPDGWDPAWDLEMVEMIHDGSSAAYVAAILEAPVSAITARFKDVCPKPTIQHRETTLRVLRRRAKAKETA